VDVGALFPISSARRLLGQPLLGFNWELIVTDPPLAVQPYLERLATRVRVAAVPGRGGQVFDTHYGPYVFTHNGKRTYPRRIALQFDESYEQQVMPVMDLWSRAAFDEESATSEPESSVKANLWLRFIGPDSEDDFTEAVHMYGAHPAIEADSPLGYNQEAMVVRSVTFAYDWWRWEPWPF
jgi:hypothetical protein